MLERTSQNLHLTMGGTHPTTILERHSQHSHLTMGGTHPPPCQKGMANTHIHRHGRTHHIPSEERPNTYIHWHDRTHHLSSKERLNTYIYWHKYSSLDQVWIIIKLDHHWIIIKVGSSSNLHHHQS